MSEGLQETLRSDSVLVTLEDHLIQRAGVLYRMGFFPHRISSSQMSTVGERIRTAPSLTEAKENVDTFLGQQLKKLTAQAERIGYPKSWALPLGDDLGGKTLGHTLIQWVVEEKYLKSETPKHLDRLHALRRFWDRFHGLYRYQAEMRHGMQLQPMHEEA